MKYIFFLALLSFSACSFSFSETKEDVTKQYQEGVEKAQDNWDQGRIVVEENIEKGKETLSDIQDRAEKVRNEAERKFDEIDQAWKEIDEAKKAIDRVLETESKEEQEEESEKTEEENVSF